MSSAQHYGTKCIGACCDNYTGDWEVEFVSTADGPMCMRCWHQKRGPRGRDMTSEKEARDG